VKPFRLEPDGAIIAAIARDEALLLQSLAAQLATLLGSPTDGDPAIVRLLPDAYPGDAEASVEFRRLTQSGLVERKIANTETVMVTLSESVDSGELRLDAAQAGAWLRSLTDLRLTLASRLGIEGNDNEHEVHEREGLDGNANAAHSSAADSDGILQELYDWLGYLQNSLVEAVDV